MPVSGQVGCVCRRSHTHVRQTQTPQPPLIRSFPSLSRVPAPASGPPAQPAPPPTIQQAQPHTLPHTNILLARPLCLTNTHSPPTTSPQPHAHALTSPGMAPFHSPATPSAATTARMTPTEVLGTVGSRPAACSRVCVGMCVAGWTGEGERVGGCGRGPGLLRAACECVHVRGAGAEPRRRVGVGGKGARDRSSKALCP